MLRGLWSEYWRQIPATLAERQRMMALAALASVVDNDTRRQWFDNWEQSLEHATVDRLAAVTLRQPAETVTMSLGDQLKSWGRWLRGFFGGGVEH
jgi:hypothetical protein